MNCSLILLIFYTIWSYPNLSVSIFYFVWKFTLKKIKLKKRRKKEKEIGQIFTHPPIIVGVNLTYLRRWESKFAIIGDIATLHLDRTTLNRFCPTNNFRLWSWALLLENSTARVLAPPQVASSPDIPPAWGFNTQLWYLQGCPLTSLLATQSIRIIPQDEAYRLLRKLSLCIAVSSICNRILSLEFCPYPNTLMV